MAAKEYSSQVGAGTERIIKVVLVLTSVNTLLTPLVFHYLEQHNFRPDALNELFGLMLVVFIISTIFWVAQVLFRAGKLLWVIPLAALLSFLSIVFITQEVQCKFNANLPKLAYSEVRITRGWPFKEYGCNAERSSNAAGVAVNTLYWSSTILSVAELVRRTKSKK